MCERRRDLEPNQVFVLYNKTEVGEKDLVQVSAVNGCHRREAQSPVFGTGGSEEAAWVSSGRRNVVDGNLEVKPVNI